MKQGGEKKRAGKREAPSGSNIWRATAKGMACAVVSTVCLLGVFAVLISTSVMPAGMMTVCVPVSCGAGALLGGRLLVSGGGKRRMLWGTGIGGGMAALLAVSGLLLYDGIALERCVVIVVACLLGGLLSGAFSKNTGRKRRT